MVASAAGYNQSVLRRRECVVIPGDPNYCTAGLIDEGAVVNGSSVTVHFQGVGPVPVFGGSTEKIPCEFVIAPKLALLSQCCF